MFRFDDTCPVFFFLCAMFGVTISGRQLCGVNMKSLSLLANTGVPHPEITPRSAKFSTNSVPLSEPPLQELHGPDSEEVRASRNNLERFQQEHGPVV